MPLPPIGTPRPNAPAAPLSPSSQVVQPLASSHVVYPSSGVVTGIPGAPFATPSFMHTAQSGPSGSSSFVRVFHGMGGTFPHPLLM